jgi:hypothetical protein
MHNKRLVRDDILKIEVLPRCASLLFPVLTIESGLELLLLHLGASIPAASVNVLQQDAVLPSPRRGRGNFSPRKDDRRDRDRDYDRRDRPDRSRSPDDR